MRVLVVSPVFHGYWRAISAALEANGNEVTTHCYDTGDLQARVTNALAHRVTTVRPQVERRATATAVAALRRARPNAVLVVKGDALGPEWWDACARTRAHTAIWLYDELARMRYSTETLAAADAVYSYSPNDVASLRRGGIAAQFLPDGYDSFALFKPRPSASVTLVGARYGPRERALTALASEGIPVQAYGREWSRHPWDVIRTRRWRSAGVTSHRDLPRAEYYGVMAGCLATLNVHGDGHDGLSMRTYEAPGVGSLQLIDRPDVARFYDVGTETLVFASDDELIDHVHRARRDPAWASKIRHAGRARTLAQHTLVHRMAEVHKRWEDSR